MGQNYDPEKGEGDHDDPDGYGFHTENVVSAVNEVHVYIGEVLHSFVNEKGMKGVGLVKRARDTNYPEASEPPLDLALDLLHGLVEADDDNFHKNSGAGSGSWSVDRVSAVSCGSDEGLGGYDRAQTGAPLHVKYAKDERGERDGDFD